MLILSAMFVPVTVTRSNSKKYMPPFEKVIGPGAFIAEVMVFIYKLESRSQASTRGCF